MNVDVVAQVKPQIEYLDFGKLVGDMLADPQSGLPNCREWLEYCITQKKKPTAGTGTTGPKVLLIDEVDVFFGDSFYGQGYRYALFCDDMYVCINKYM